MKENGINYIGDAVAVVCTAVQPDEVLRIVSMIITIIATMMSITYTLYNWWKSAKSDGKITKDEVKEAHDIIHSGLDDINKAVKTAEGTEENDICGKNSKH